MGTEVDRRFQELFNDEEDENPEDGCIHERQLKMKIDELTLIYGSHPVSDTPFDDQMMTGTPKPSVIIFAHLTDDSLNMIEKIQDEIVNNNPDHEPLRIRREKIHVTLVATYSEDGLEQLFNKTIHKV